MSIHVIQELVRVGLLQSESAPFCADFRRHVKLYFPAVAVQQKGLFVKISQTGAVVAECQALVACQPHFQPFIVAPISYWQMGEEEVAVFPLKALAPVSPADLSQPSVNGQLAGLFRQFFTQPVDSGREAGQGDADPTSLAGRCRVFSRQMRDYLAAAKSFLEDKFPPVNQHGDLAINNLALGAQGALLLFDWEDYGKVRYPFFDLATLLFSVAVAQEQVDELGERPETLLALPGWPAVARCCVEQGLESDDFVRLFPFYLLCFLRLKDEQGYGESIAGRIERFLECVVVSEQWLARIRWTVH